jgi:hypothetical protein
MGQHFSNTNEFKLFEWTKFTNLKNKQTYTLSFESYEYEGIFWNYEYKEDSVALFIEQIHTKNITEYNILQVDATWDFHRFIYEKEYRTKLRDKYNETVLNIILKRLINENFKWY